MSSTVNLFSALYEFMLKTQASISKLSKASEYKKAQFNDTSQPT